ncbi:hypothetical protein BSZ35_00255 [Salinibacter sp. 10B]|uniref:replication initiator protein A n=1 Tax=Salinibacter sp. 10B TaxID=1923971 RepID=UPI000CF46423|nr:replication initiator protein A [Salinibacter sp. 10B]PQJ36821.1 hypothetical protein BSZ35_00255 [Salinibacter sp. 10B]
MSDLSQMTLFEEEEPTLVASGIDDMNLVEVLLGLPGRRRPPEDKTISVPWEKDDRSYYLEYNNSWLRIDWESRRRDTGKKDDFYLEVRSPESKGLPTKSVEDVFVALMDLTARENFTSPKIKTTRHELLSIMKHSDGGKAYQRLEETLSQLVNLTVETNAFWNPKKETYFKSEFSIIDSTDLERSQGDHNAETHITWGSKMFEIFQKGYLKRLDTDFYYSLSNTTTRRIFRWLDKHFRHYPTVEVDVLRFAHKTLGFGVSYKYPSQVLQKLEKRLDELVERGFCKWKVVDSKTDSGRKFIFSRRTQYTAVLFPRRDLIIEALERHGLNRASEFVDRHGWDRCLRHLEYLEHRLQSGKKEIQNPGGWLADAIEQDRRLPSGIKEKISECREQTVEWCNQMYQALSLEEKSKLEQRIKKELEGCNEEEKEIMERQWRNRLLLNRIKQF